MIVFLITGCLVANPHACWTEKWKFDNVKPEQKICEDIFWDLAENYLKSNAGYALKDWGCLPLDPIPEERADNGESGSNTPTG